MKTEKYVGEAADKISQIAIKKWDATCKLALIYLADKGHAVPCFELDYLGHMADEQERHFRIVKMSNLGLVEIIEAEDNILKTTCYRITAYGSEVGKRVKKLEAENSNPSINCFFEKTTRAAMKARYPQFVEQIDALEESIFSIGAPAAEVLSI